MLSIKKSYILLACILASNTVQANDWQPVGEPGFSAGSTWYTKIVISNGVPYIAYGDTSNSREATVMKYNGTSWEYVGNPGFSAGRVRTISLALSNEVPYVAYQDYENSYKATVMKYNGTSWEPVGNPGFSKGEAWYTNLAISNGVPFIAYQDEGNSNKATVMKYNNISWEYVGNPGFSTGTASQPSLAMFNGVPYVAYEDSQNDGATVMKYNGTFWEYVGNPGFSGGFVWLWQTSLAISNGIPYVAYRDIKNNFKATVMKYNGTSWEYVGNRGFSAGEVKPVSLAISDGIPYVAYTDYKKGYKATVMKYNGTSWEYVGNQGFSAGETNYTDLAISNGVPYVIYKDGKYGGKATVMKYTSTGEKIPCCSYTDANGNTRCSPPIPITFKECKNAAREDGAEKFKWGMVDRNTVDACGINGKDCGNVQEYLKVTLNKLTTSISKNQLVIQWDTTSEENNLGMNLWCAQLHDGHFRNVTQLNNQLIPSKTVLPNYGASYSSTDYPYINTHLQPGIQHCTLEDIDTRGQCMLHCDQISTTVIGDNNLSNTELDKLQTKAITLCHEHKLEGTCLDQLLAPNQ